MTSNPFKILLTINLVLFSSTSFSYVSSLSDSTIALNNESLDQLIKDEHILKLESLVPLLPEDMRLNFVFKNTVLNALANAAI